MRTAAARLLVRGTGCGYSLQNFKHGIYLVDAASPNVGDGIFWSKEQSCQEQLEVLWLCFYWLSWFMSENISLHMCSLFLNERVMCLAHALTFSTCRSTVSLRICSLCLKFVWNLPTDLKIPGAKESKAARQLGRQPSSVNDIPIRNRRKQGILKEKMITLLYW